MQYNEILLGNIDLYDPIVWLDGPVYKRYYVISDYLANKLGAEYAELLSFPNIRGNYGSWTTKIIGENFTTYNKLPESKKAGFQEKLSDNLGRVSKLIQQLREKADSSSQDMAELLSLAFLVPDEGHIICDLETQSICFAAWSFEYSKSNSNEVKALQLLGVHKALGDFPEPKSPENEDLKINVKVEPQFEVTTQNKPKTGHFPSEAQDSNTQDPFDEGDKRVEIGEAEKSKSPERKGKKFHWILWGILPLLLMLIFWHFNQESSRAQLESFLPEEPNVLPPIDTSFIIIDENNPLKPKLISNRLNIYLTQGTDLEDFAQKLVEKYKEKFIEIVYYSPLTNKLMVEFLPEDREYFKEEFSSSFKNVEFVMEENLFNNFSPPQNFNDPGFNETSKSWFLERIQAFDAWKITLGDPNIVVAVIDDGFDLKHPEFSGKVVHPYNIAENTPKVNTGNIGLFHGTHVAGSVGANSNNLEGIAGVAPKCKLMPIQVSTRWGVMTTSAIVDGLFYALNHNADIVNLSLGSAFTANLESLSPQEQGNLAKTLYPEQGRFWNKLFKKFYDKGIIIVQAAGNSNILASIDPMHRNPYTIKVSATNQGNNKASFSNFGKMCKHSAPGTAIYSSIPGNNFDFSNGTSMAAPLVSGGVALLKSKNPSLSPFECSEILFNTGLPVGSNVGRLIQLGDALGYEVTNQIACSEQIEKLKEEIENLKNKLTDSNEVGLVIPENPKDLSFAEGLWKSTTPLVSTIDEERVELFFRFSFDGTGELTIVENGGDQCKAPLDIKLTPNKMEIDQLTEAVCRKGINYSPYTCICISKNNQIAQCNAYNKQNQQQTSFRLVKVGSF